MRWLKKNLICEVDVILLVILFLSSNLRSYYYILPLFSYLLLLIIKKDGIIKKTKDAYLQIFYFYCIFTAIVGIHNLSSRAWPYLRDIINVVAVLIIIQISRLHAEKNRYKMSVLYKTMLIYFAYRCLISLIPILHLLIQGKDFLAILNANRPSELVLGIGLYMVFFMRQNLFTKGFNCFIKVIIFLTFALSLSRTSIVVFMILLFFSIKDRTSVFLKTIMVILIGVFCLYEFYPELVNSYIQKIARSSLEISNKMNWNEITITNNWRGYEIYCAQEQFKNSDTITQLIGSGYGASIDVKGYAYLVTTEDKLPYLHNGYYNVLIRSGILGILSNMLFYVFLFIRIKKTNINKSEKDLLYGLVISMVVMSWVVGGIFTGGNYDFWIFVIWLLGGKVKQDESVNYYN